MTQCDTVYVNTNEHYRANIETETREARFVKWLKDKYPAHSVAKSNPILQRLRSVKDSIELALMQKACDITEKGFRRVLNFVKPNVWEYDWQRLYGKKCSNGNENGSRRILCR